MDGATEVVIKKKRVSNLVEQLIFAHVIVAAITAEPQTRSQEDKLVGNPLLYFQKYKLAPKTFGFRHQGDPSGVPPEHPNEIRAPIS